MEYKFLINDFEGPLDLLLHLIKENDLNIEDIKINEITKQYLDYIKKMEELNLNVASEYLVMAAELIEIKSKMLLPNESVLEESVLEEDPKDALIKRLIEYKKYKEITKQLKKLEEDRNNIYTKKLSDLTKIIDTEVNDAYEDLDINVLVDAFNLFLKRKKEDAPLNTKITKKEYSIRKRSLEIMNKVSLKDKVEFTELFENTSKGYIVVTFLSILNLSKKKMLLIKQDNNFNKIFLSKREGE